MTQAAEQAETRGPDHPAEAAAVFVAGMWRRLGAALIDAVLLAPVLWLLGFLAFLVAGYRAPLGPKLGLASLLELLLDGGGALYGFVGVGLLILLLYGFLFLTTAGATPGLRAVGLRVISVYGQRPEWWRMLLRCVGFVLGVLSLGLGFLWMGFDREKRGLHDWMAGTYVIRSRGERKVLREA